MSSGILFVIHTTPAPPPQLAGVEAHRQVTHQLPTIGIPEWESRYGPIPLEEAVRAMAALALIDIRPGTCWIGGNERWDFDDSGKRTLKSELSQTD